jgi:hypothetical protein
MLRNALLAIGMATLLTACETPTTGRYAISADNNMAIKALGSSGIGIGSFTPPATFSDTCRGLGPLRVSDNLTHTQYVQKAFEDELKVAGAFAANAARVTLTGKVDQMEFSSTRGLTGGSWAIDLTLASSNGQSMAVKEYYEFDSGFIATEACRQTAEAFSRAVQNLVGKTIRNPSFAQLIR